MNEIRIAVIEDDASDRKRLCSILRKAAADRNLICSIQEYDRAEPFLFHYEPSYDIVFMDIMLGDGLSGMEAAQKLRQKDQTVLLVFVTNMLQMALQGYEVDALDFILKPVQEYSFGLKLNRILGRIGCGQQASVLVHTEDRSVKLRVQTILYLKVQGHYVEYHSRQGVLTQYISLAAAEKELSDACFFRCDRSHLVNLRHVSSVSAASCTVDGEELPLARTQRNDFLRAYAEYLGGQRR